MNQNWMLSWILFWLIHSSATFPDDASEEPFASSWLDSDWSVDNVVSEEEIRDPNSGCICRYKHLKVVVCYGGPRCNSFPSRITLPENVYDMQVKNSGLRILGRNDLDGLRSLRHLQIDANYQLQHIERGVFVHMSNLRFLSISYNAKLQFIANDTFIGLTNLERLRLVKNGFVKVFDVADALLPDSLPKLKSLSLNENSFQEIPEYAFRNMFGTSVVELELMLCQIEVLHPRALTVFKNLESLRIGDNLIKEGPLGDAMEELIKEEIPLNLLNLYNSGFRKSQRLIKLMSIISRSNVTHLILSRNHIESISKDIFPRMPNLVVLDLREVSAITLESDTLGQETFPKLEKLLLGGNKLSGVLPGIRLPHLRTLDLTDNSSGGSKFPSYFDVISNCLSGMTNLQQLDLSNNRISTITDKAFSDLNRLRVLGLRNATLFFIARNAFNNMTDLQVLNLEYNDHEPFNKFENPIYSRSLEKLYLSYCGITAFRSGVFEGLRNLKYLELRGNKLTVLEPDVLYPLIALIGLDLSENLMKSWFRAPIFVNNSNLRIVRLPENKLSTITPIMMADFTKLSKLDMSGNSFFCDCRSMNLTMSWLKKRNQSALGTVLSGPGNVCSFPEELREQPLAQYLIESSGDCIESTVVVSDALESGFIFMGILVAISLVLGILVYVYRWHIRYWAFLARITFLRRHSWLLKKNKIHPKEYKYDVFVSYSHEDRNFIVRLVSMLENQEPYLKLCVYERDFEIGTVISDTVMEKVGMSRRTLLVVSNAFAKSQWCMWELQLAEYHRLFFRRAFKDNLQDDPLVIVKLGPIAQCNMTPTLKFLLKSRIYLEWNHEAKKQTVFWNRLRDTLNPVDRRLRPTVDTIYTIS